VTAIKGAGKMLAVRKRRARQPQEKVKSLTSKEVSYIKSTETAALSR